MPRAPKGGWSASRDVPACAACGVETESTAAVPDCPICADERQYIPADGQVWTSRSELAASGREITVSAAEAGLFSLRTSPRTGIGQTCYLAQAPCDPDRPGHPGQSGGLLFDVPPYIDEAAVQAVAERGGVAAIVASHPHMYGMQLEWSAAFGDAPVFVSRKDAGWVQRWGPAIELYDSEVEAIAGVRVRQVGGHFPGSSVALWPSPEDGRTVMLGGDTIAPVARRGWVTFMRSFPNYLPLSGAVVQRIAAALSGEEIERIHGNFGQRLMAGGSRAIAESAQRYAAWVSGAYDHLT